MWSLISKKILLFFLLLNSIFLYGQQNTLKYDSSLISDSALKLQNKSRTKLLIAGTAVAYGATMAILYQEWYRYYPQSSFHFINDNAEYFQMDKMSHVWATYTISRLAASSWRWAGKSHKKSAWIGGITGLAFQTIAEGFDGFSDNWGFSSGDMFANIMGSASFVTQELLWKEQRIQIKYSVHANDYSSSQQLNDRINQYYGRGPMSRIIKDYNGQTYWLSANLKSFFPHSNLPAWLNFSFGHGAENMYGGEENIWTDANGNHINRTDIIRYRRLHFAPDVDLTKIKTKSKFLKTLFFTLNTFKFPAPSIEFSQGTVKWNWIMF